jgi:hypothetical protein
MVILAAWSNENPSDKKGSYMKKYILLILVLATHTVLAQGFLNLDFESANLSGYSAGSVPATNAIPGWTAYLGGIAQTNINYNVSSGGGGIQVDILGSTSLQGNYFIYIGGTRGEPASIGQTATIPVTAQSLIWWGSGPNGLSFNGQALSFSVIGSGSNYAIFAANISAFAGDTGQLLFTSGGLFSAPGAFIDNIQFSTSPVPEPGFLSLLGLGSLGFLWLRRKTKPVQ